MTPPFGLTPRRAPAPELRRAGDAPPAPAPARRVTCTVERFGDDVRATLEAADVPLESAGDVLAELEAAIAAAQLSTPGLVPGATNVGGGAITFADDGDGARGRRRRQ